MQSVVFVFLCGAAEYTAEEYSTLHYSAASFALLLCDPSVHTRCFTPDDALRGAIGRVSDCSPNAGNSFNFNTNTNSSSTSRTMSGTVEVECEWTVEYGQNALEIRVL